MSRDHPYISGNELPRRYSDAQADNPERAKTRTVDRLVTELESAAAAAAKDGDTAMAHKLQCEAEEWRASRYHDAPPPRKPGANTGGRQIVTARARS